MNLLLEHEVNKDTTKTMTMWEVQPSSKNKNKKLI
jgi:hypothetical protein